jgi:hypothetical protein
MLAAAGKHPVEQSKEGAFEDEKALKLVHIAHECDIS